MRHLRHHHPIHGQIELNFDLLPELPNIMDTVEAECECKEDSEGCEIWCEFDMQCTDEKEIEQLVKLNK